MSRPPRIDGFSYLGPNRYFVTFCTCDRRDVFGDIAIGEFVLLQIRRTSRRCQFAILAYCLMPDHVHLLVEGTSATSDFRRFIKSLKQGSGQWYAARWKSVLWQEGYYDHVLRRDEDAKEIARYIVNNPLRAGLVRTAVEYPLVGSDIWRMEDLLDSLI